MRFFISLVIGLLITSNTFALTCKQSEIAPLADTYQQTESLSKQFLKIDHIEVLPQKITPESQGFIVNTIQVLICGELLPESPKANNTPGQACQFDSNCQAPMRCRNQVCVIPNEISN